MKLAGMQPYFFPYLGYYALIKHSNKWVVADNVQHISRGWIERNRILNPNNGWHYIRVPLEKASHKQAIKSRKIRNNENWQQKIFSQLVHYKNIAPYYRNVTELLEETFSYQTDSIVDLNIRSLELVCQYLKIPFNYFYASNLDIDRNKIKESDDWALQIALLIGADQYLNPPGGIDFYNRDKFDQNHVSLKFLKVHLNPYDQHIKPFEPGLSIIDVMMFNSPSRISEMLDDYEFL